jgi:hypothetical protein
MAIKCPLTNTAHPDRGRDGRQAATDCKSARARAPLI